jgi:2-dehydro-3-deoxyphosphogluconate aldolase/(4S)-4-hydroxy-2-oxoglutarate aldolase
MATGGVEPTKESITAWFKAGVTCVGIGSKLFPKEVIENGNWEKITQLCRECISIIQQTR